jgi:hypothetical protein
MVGSPFSHHQTFCSERFPDPTSNCEIESTRSLGESTYVVNSAPISFTCRCACDTSEAGKESLRKGVDRIGRRFLVLANLATACSDVKAEEILYRCYVESVYPFAETVLSGAGLIGDRKS